MNYLYIKEKNCFGDIEIVSNKKYSLFNIKANEDNSIVSIMERKRWCGVIDKFNKIISNKIDILHKRIKEIILKKNNI